MSASRLIQTRAHELQDLQELNDQLRKYMAENYKLKLNYEVVFFKLIEKKN